MTALRWSPDRTRATTPDGYVVESRGTGECSGRPLLRVVPPGDGFPVFLSGRTWGDAERDVVAWIEGHRERTKQPRKQGALL